MWNGKLCLRRGIGCFTVTIELNELLCDNASKRKSYFSSFKAEAYLRVRRNSHFFVKTSLILAVVSGILSALHAAAKAVDADEILYLKDAAASHPNVEQLFLYVHEDGSIVGENGSKRTPEQLRHSFVLWRKHGPNPYVCLFLYPQLRSNNDLQRIREITAFLATENVFWELGVYSARTPIPDNLRSRPTKRKR